MAEDRISVVARIRPGWGENQIEWVKNGRRDIVKKDGTEIYTFDNVFDQLCSNELIYENVMAGLVDAALSGFNTAVCAYGQSGAGKTHTLTGSENEDGLVQNIFRALLKLSQRKFIPYRNFKLTRTLKPSLGGNSKTVIICCVAPFSIAETSSTLKFAKLAKKIVTRPVVNEVSHDGVLAGYLREIAELKEKLEKANNKKDEEEKGREQRMKLAGLTKGILKGRNALEAASVLSRKTRRQTWAPGNGMLGLLNGRSFSTPCKKERGLGLLDEYEGQKSSETIDDIDMDIKRSLSRASSELMSEKREVEVQTMDPYPIDQSDEYLP